MFFILKKKKRNHDDISSGSIIFGLHSAKINENGGLYCDF
jgi:hypothetical protein